MKIRDQMYEIAKGEIAEPKITIVVEGAETVFTGREAKAFALGVLLGIKSERVSDSVSVQREVIED